MHPTLSSITNKKEDEAKRQNINVFPPNVAIPKRTTGLEDKPLLPSVFRPNSTLFTNPLNVIPTTNPGNIIGALNNPSITDIQSTASKEPWNNTITSSGLINSNVSAIQNPVFNANNSVNPQPVYNAFLQVPPQPGVVVPMGRGLPGFTQAGHGLLRLRSQILPVIPMQNIAQHPGNNVSGNTFALYNHAPTQAYQRLPHQFITSNAIGKANTNLRNETNITTSYQFGYTQVKSIPSVNQMPTQNYMPNIHNKDSITYMNDNQGDDPANLNPTLTGLCTSFEEQRSVADNEEPLDSYEQAKHLVNINVMNRQLENSALLETQECSSKSNESRPFFGVMKQSSDFMHSSSLDQENSMLPNREYSKDYDLGEMSFDNNLSDVRTFISEEKERFPYLEERGEEYFPERNRNYDYSSCSDKFDRDESERQGLKEHEYFDSTKEPYLSRQSRRYESPPRYSRVGKDNSNRHSRYRGRHDSYDRVSENRSSVDKQNFFRRVQSRSRSPVQRYRGRSKERMDRPKDRHDIPQEKDKLGNERHQSYSERSKSGQHSSRQSSSPVRKRRSLNSDNNVKNKRSESRCSESRGKSEKTERSSLPKQMKNKDDKSTSRALKCYCLPEPYTQRTFVYQQSSRYYQESSSSQRSTSTATDNVTKLHKEFEEMISKSQTVNDSSSTSSFKDTVQNSEEDTQYVSKLLDDIDDEDNDVNSETDVNLKGYDIIDEYDSDGSNDDITMSLKGNEFKNQKHPRKLHPEMWFNVEGELNHGKECLCSLKDKKKWIVHNVYPNEQLPKACEAMGNNGLQLYHYWVTVFPHPNFMTENPTTIEYNGRTYTFEGFSLLSHSPLDDVPRCFLTRFNFKYEIFFIQEPIPTNFCIKDLNLLSKFLFHDLLEMYDWKISEEDEDSCDLFHFLPRFTYWKSVSDDGIEKYELLSMRKVFEHLIKSRTPLITEKVLKSDRSSWKDFVSSCVNSIATRPGWKPSSIRIDDIERDKERGEPVIVHHGIRPVELSFSGDPKCQKLMKKYLKMRTLIMNKPDVSQKERLQLIKMKLTLDNMKMKDSLRRNCCVRVSTTGMMKTGLNSDVTQHALLLPVLAHHVRYHLSLQTFDEKIGYVFKDRSLLQLALTHPSYVMNYGTNPDHARNTLSNCGVKQPRYGDRRNRLIHTKKKGIVQLIDIMAKLEDLDGSQSFIQHNERLEFLGDAILEFICTCHLYFLFPEMTEGGLVTHRSSLVQNKHLAQVAQKLGLDNFMQFSHGPDLCHQEDMQHALANCLEALLGAIYLDSDVSTVQKVFCKLVFEEIEYRKLWCTLPQHPLQEQQPEGDRQFISSSDVLKRLVKFEEAVGVQFKHIRLLARAFTHPQVGYNNLTLGNNQRMELLGDSLVQWVVTDYLYHHFPEHHEGHLTLLRSSLVNRTIQAQIAGEIGLDRHVHFGVGPVLPKLRQKHMSDLFEAFLAALFVDKGIEPVEVFCKVCLFPRLRSVIVNQEWMDAKSQLQSCCLTQSTHSDNVPVYKVLKNVGSPNMKLYKVGVYFNNKRLATGFGDSIREAEMNAAQNALATNYFPEYARQKRVVHRQHKVSKRVRPEAK